MCVLKAVQNICMVLLDCCSLSFWISILVISEMQTHAGDVVIVFVDRCSGAAPPSKQGILNCDLTTDDRR